MMRDCQEKVRVFHAVSDVPYHIEAAKSDVGRDGLHL